MIQEFSGKSALVIGGSSGIGRAVAHRLADGGAQVLVVGRDAHKLAHSAAEREASIQTLQADITTPVGLRALTEALRPPPAD